MIRGPVYRINPLRPVADLIAEAHSLVPPTETGDFEMPDLVDLATMAPDLAIDMRYALDDNFLGVAVYDAPRALAQRPVADALVEADRELAADGLGLVVYDAYRPWWVTWVFWEATPPELRTFVATPSWGSRHNRGCAVDVTLIDRSTGIPLPMPSGFDEFTPRAFAAYDGGSHEETANRQRLIEVMARHDFRVNPDEWWHYDYHQWRSYRVLNRPIVTADAT